MIYLVTNSKELFPNEHYKIISVEESFSILNPMTIVGLDTETEGFSPYLKKLLLVQLGNKDNQVVIDCRTVDIALYKDYLESDRLFILANGKFDLRFFFYHNIIIYKNLWDVFLAEKMIWLGYPAGVHSLSLKAMAEEYLGVLMDKSVRGEILWRKTLTNSIIIYAATDTTYLEDIMLKQQEILYSRGQKNGIALENKSLPWVAYTEYCGVRLDVPKWKNKMKKDEELLQESINKLNTYVEEHYGNNPKFCKINLQGDLFTGFDTKPHCIINWASTKQAIPFFETLGFNCNTIDKKTKKEKKSIEEDVIKKQRKINPEFVDNYLKYKGAFKVCTTYGQNVIDLINPVTGRIHSQLNQIGTDTNRLSSGGGEDKEVIPGRAIKYINLQNLPANAETRSCFISEDNNVWISRDFSGEESVILANISKDPKLIEVFTTGCKDLHSLMAKAMFPDEVGDCPVEQIKAKFPKVRKKSKGPEFLLGYGGNAFAMSTTYNLPIGECKSIENNYRKEFKGIAKYQDYRRSLALKQDYIVTCPEVGFRVNVYNYSTLKSLQSKMDTEYWNEYRAAKSTNNYNIPILQEVKDFSKKKSDIEKHNINYPIQARGSAIFKIASVKFFKWIVQNNYFNIVKLCIPVHDEWNVECPYTIADEVQKKLDECMVTAGKYICRIVPLHTDLALTSENKLPNYWIH